MTAYGDRRGRAFEPADVPLTRVIGYLLGVAVLAASLTLLFLSMRAVLEIGGACASGGPYVPRVECPDTVVAFTPLSIFTGFAGAGLMLWGGSAIPGPWASFVLLAWPALFVSLGFNFLQYGFFPPEGAEGWVWSWIFCGFLFMAMGLGPLLGVIGAVRETHPAGGRAFAGGRVIVRPRPRPEPEAGAGPEARAEPESRATPGVEPESRATASDGRGDGSGGDGSGDGSGDDPDIVERLERLAALRRAGDITNDEYELAKARLLRGGQGPDA